MPRTVLLALLPAAIACSSEDARPPPLSATGGATYPGCEHAPTVQCDIALASCQEQLFELTRCLRGNEAATLPPISLMDEAAAFDHLLGLVNETVTLPPSEDRTHVGRALSLLDLQKGEPSLEDSIRAEVKSLLGFYTPVTGGIVIVQHPGEAGESPLSTSGRVANFTLVHEFVHALQDEQLDLLAAEGRFVDFDSELAGTAVIEGEATLYHNFYAVLMDQQRPSIVDWVDTFAELTPVADDTVLEVGSPISSTKAVFPYIYGAHQAASAWTDGQRHALDALLERPPNATRAIINAVDGRPASSPSVEFTPPSPLDGFRHVASDALGAYVAFAFLAATPLGREDARAIAGDLQGDALYIYGNDSTEETVAVWRMRWTTDAAAASMAAAINGSAPYRAASSAGAITTVVQSGSASLTESAALESTPPALRVGTPAPVTPGELSRIVSTHRWADWHHATPHRRANVQLR